MAKLFSEMNYYEILDISPSASPFEIRNAYKMALTVYQEDSLVSYSFFSREDREKILAWLENGYRMLVNEKERVVYDRLLIDRGEMKDEEQYWKCHKAVPQMELPPPNGLLKKTVSMVESLKSKVGENERVKAILAQEDLKGSDLKKIREELGVALEQVAQETKIRTGLLQCLEEDQFSRFPSRHHLKGFLKSYLQCLRINLDGTLDRYMKRVPS